MADASYAIPSFLGGEISKFAQGRFDKPDYRISLNVCFNSYPVEIGTWTRRPGTVFASTTRGGGKGRVIKFDFKQEAPYTLEFTSGFLRFRNGAVLVKDDTQSVVSISGANPSVIQTASASTWQTGQTVMFDNLGEFAPTLQNRQCRIVELDPINFSIFDAITGAPIDGASLGSIPVTPIVQRVHELATTYAGESWSGIRAVQAETTDILLCGTIPPQALTVETEPTPQSTARFAIESAVFNDGPYLDPFTNGVQATPSAVSGIIAITLAFPAWSSATAYAEDSFVTAGGVNYVSIINQNVGNPPATNPGAWLPTPAGAAIGPNGFQGSDVGRLVRLFSEPAAWAAGSTYALNVVVSYNPSGLDGQTTYWTSLVGGNIGSIPGVDTAHWTLTPANAALWTWGKITSLANGIDRALAGSASIGDMTGGGGLAAAFDGVFVQAAAAAAESTVSGGAILPNNSVTLSSYVGKNYAGASDQKIQQATVYPSSDLGLAFGSYIAGIPPNPATLFGPTIVLNLRAKASAPAAASDGLLLGTSGPISNSVSSVTIVSTDQVTAWKYVWVEQVTTAAAGVAGAGSYTLTNAVGELALFNPTGTGSTASGVNVAIIGPPLLYTVPIKTWRLGAYSDTTGWPTCGTYDDGRLWLGGAIPNRFDACVSNGIKGGTIDFAPTNQYGAVATSNAITYVFDSDGANQIQWMKPEEAGITMGTLAGEWLVRAPQTGAIGPTNISARRVTKIGAAGIEPCRTEHTNIFVQRFRRKLTEFFPDAYSGKFTGPNLADKAEHIVSAGIAEIAYTSSVTPIIWGRDQAGALFGVTYKRDTLTTSQPPTFAAWHRHALGSGRVIESLCAGPSTGGDLDTLTVVTNDPATGIRHVELLTDTPGENAPFTQAWFLDDAVRPSSTTVLTAVTVDHPYGALQLNGLWHLNGSTVSVYAAGLDCGDYLVTNGSVIVPFGDGISAGAGEGLFTAAAITSFGPPGSYPIVAGFTYNSDGQLVRPIAQADTGARNGPGFGKKRRVHRYAAQLVNALGVSIGTSFDDLLPMNFQQANTQAIVAQSVFSGIHEDTIADDYSFDGMICWRVSRPYPANLVAIGGNIQTMDQ